MAPAPRDTTRHRCPDPAGDRRTPSLLVWVAAIVLSGWAAACASGRGGPPDPCFASEPERCFVSHGAHVVLDPAVARDPAAVDRAVGRALAYWAAPARALDGWRITFEEREVECNGARASGCCSWRERTIRLHVLDPDCPETAQLVHEMGHVLHRDPGHRDARWSWEREQEATRALVRATGASAGCRRSPYYTAPAAGRTARVRGARR